MFVLRIWIWNLKEITIEQNYVLVCKIMHENVHFEREHIYTTALAFDWQLYWWGGCMKLEMSAVIYFSLILNIQCAKAH